MAKNDENFANIGERFCKIKAVFCENSNRKFSQIANINQQNLSSICSGRRNAGKEVIDRVLSAFPEISRTWLILGEGDMITTPNVDNSTTNNIHHTGSGCTNTINSGGHPDILDMYEARLSDKDAVIDTLRDTIHTLQGEVEQLRAYVKLTSTKYIEEIERMRNITSDTHDMVKEATSRIGFKCGKADGEQQ